MRFPLTVLLMFISRRIAEKARLGLYPHCAQLVINIGENVKNRFIFEDIYLYLLDI